MEYQLYKLKFPNGVHFGNGSLDSSEYTFCADTLFSALCQTAAKIGDDKLKELVACAGRGGLAISDAFPCMGKELFLPKPVMYVGGGEDRGASIIKKHVKRIEILIFRIYSVGGKSSSQSVGPFMHRHHSIYYCLT